MARDRGNCILGKNVKIGENVELGNNVIICENVDISDSVSIEHNTIVGYNHLTHLRPEFKGEPLVTRIGRDTLIRPNSVIYAGSSIGEHSQINQGVILREFTEIGHHSSIGSLCMCEGYTKIGNYCTIYENIMLPISIEILIIFALILLNGVLAMAEIALVSARKSRLEHQSSQGKNNARIALKLANSPGKFLATVQIGITLVGIMAGAFGGATLAQALDDVIKQIPI